MKNSSRRYSVKKNSSTKHSKPFIPFLFVLLLCILMAVPAAAYQTRSNNFWNVSLSGDQASDMVAVAKKQKDRSQGSMGYTEAWCADFVLDCAKKANIPTSIIPSTTPACANCTSFYNKMITLGGKTVSASQAKPGDLVFYKCSKCNSYVHVGIYCGNGSFIEGNVSSKVLQYSTNYYDKYYHSTKDGTVKRVYVHPDYVDYNIAHTQIKLSSTSYTYNLMAHTPGVTITANKKTLVNGTDYTLQYFNTVNAGTASVKITGKGKYFGTKTVTYTIKPFNISGVSGFSVYSCVYTGKQLKPSVRFSGSKTIFNLINRSGNIRITYGTNIGMGRGVVYVTGINNLSGTKTLYFDICPKKVTSLSTTIRAGRVTLKWSSLPGVSGYEISYKKANASGWNITRRGGASCVLELSRLTKYQVRVRAYYTSNGRTVYGAWSDTKTFTTNLFF